MDKRTLKKLDEKYRAWLRTLPSCVSSKSPCIAAHVRRARNSGTGMKPLFSAVPLTDEEHRYQHDHGELACYLRFRTPGLIMYDVSRITELNDVLYAKQWFDAQAAYHLEWWKKETGVVV